MPKMNIQATKIAIVYFVYDSKIPMSTTAKWIKWIYLVEIINPLKNYAGCMNWHM